MPEETLNICNTLQHLFTYSNGITQRWPMSCTSRVVSSTHSAPYNIIFPLGSLLPAISQFLLWILTLTLTLTRLMSYIYIYIYVYMEHPFLMFLDHTQWRTTLGRTPLDEWSAHRRDLYLATHDTHNRQISMPPVGFEPTISAGERPAAVHLLRSLGSNPTGGMHIYLLWVSCVVR